MLKHDNQWMRDALRLAELAAAQGEIPVGAIVVQGDKCIFSFPNSVWECLPRSSASHGTRMRNFNY